MKPVYYNKERARDQKSDETATPVQPTIFSSSTKKEGLKPKLLLQALAVVRAVVRASGAYERRRSELHVLVSLK